MAVLLLTNSGDVTSDHLESCLAAQTVPYCRYNTDGDLEDTLFSYHNNYPQLRWGKHEIGPADVSAVIYRRPKPFRPVPSDDEFRDKHTADEWAEAWEGFLAHIEPERWINHPSRNFLASHKIDQLTRAHALGLAVPPSLVTNRPDEAQKFLNEQAAQVIVKPLASGFIERADPVEDSLIYTHAFKDEHHELLPLIRHCPVLFQVRVRKLMDVRLTFLDGQMIAMGMTSQEPDGEQCLDIRRDNMSNVEYCNIEIPMSVASKVKALMECYGLRFGALDFIIEKYGEWVFLEINPNGQWAWLDLEADAGIGKMFAIRLNHLEEEMKQKTDHSRFDLFEAVESCGTKLTNLFTYALLFVLNPGHRYNEIVAKCLFHEDNAHTETEESTWDNGVSEDIASLQVDESRERWKEEEERRKIIDDKSKMLLTVAALLVAAIAALFPHVDPRWISLLPLLPVITCVYLVLMHFQVQHAKHVDAKTVNNLRRVTGPRLELAREYLSCAEFSAPRNDYRVGIYRAAARSLLLGLFLFLPVFFVAGFEKSNRRTPKAPREEHNHKESAAPNSTSTVQTDSREPEASHENPSPKSK